MNPIKILPPPQYLALVIDTDADPQIGDTVMAGYMFATYMEMRNFKDLAYARAGALGVQIGIETHMTQGIVSVVEALADLARILPVDPEDEELPEPKQVWYIRGSSHLDGECDTKEEAERIARTLYPDESPDERYARIYYKMEQAD